MCYLFLLDPIDRVSTKTDLIKWLGMHKLIVSHHPGSPQCPLKPELETYMYDGQPSIVGTNGSGSTFCSDLDLGTPPNAY